MVRAWPRRNIARTSPEQSRRGGALAGAFAMQVGSGRMELVEIVVQGLQGASDLSRAPFQPGVTVFAAGPRERLYARLVLDLLYPKGSEPTLAELATPGGQSRVALLVRGRDGNLYRLLVDVQNGRRALQR